MSSRHATLRSALRGAGFASLTAAAVTLTPEAAVAAPAAERPGVFVTPVSPAPGTDIVLAVSGCAEHTATATSDAFVADARLAGADGTLVGESRVRSSARPGKYDVQVVCGIVRIKGALTVTAAMPPAFEASVSTAPKPAAPATASTPTPSTASSPATASTEPAPATTLTSATPVAPVHAGGGGTAGLVAVDAVAAVDDTDGSRASGSDAAQSATGLVLAAAAATAVALRGSRRRRESD